MNKRTIVRISTILALILVGIGLYEIGRAHTFLPENKTIEIDGKDIVE